MAVARPPADVHTEARTGRENMADKSELKYTADQLRDYGNDEQKVQATMQEETAVALHRVAEAIEDLTSAIEYQHDND